MTSNTAVSAVAIDTATELLSIALVGGKTGTQRRFVHQADAGLQHGSNLLPAVQWLLGRAGITAAELELIVCCDGPGSFTGLRIGMATAKGLAVAARAPLVVVPTLDALAWPHREWPGMIVAAIDARKQRLYCALYRKERKLSDDLDLCPKRLNDLIETTAMPDEPILVTGPAAPQLCDFFSSGTGDNSGESSADRATRQRVGARVRCDPAARSGAAVGLLELGLARARRGEYAAENHGPHYVRISDAEIGITAPRQTGPRQTG